MLRASVVASSNLAWGSNFPLTDSVQLFLDSGSNFIGLTWSKFSGPRGPILGHSLPLAQSVAQVPYKNEAERSSRSRKKNCTVAQSVERPAVNGKVIGSSPICAAIWTVCELESSLS